MADGTKAGADAPRTLFSLGRAGKRKGRVAEASPLENYPPRHAEEGSLDLDDELTEAVDTTDDDLVTADHVDAEPDTDALCPSCELPLVPGAMFCGECGTRVIAAEDAVPTGVLLDDAVPGEPLPPTANGAFEVAEPLTGTSDEDEIADAGDDGSEIGEVAAFGAFIGATAVGADADADDADADDADAEPHADAETEIEAEEVELVEDVPVEEPEAELEDELVEDIAPVDGDAVAEDVVAEDVVEDDSHDGAVPLVAGAAAAGAGTAALVSTDGAGAETLTSTGSSAGSAGGGSGSGSKKGVWIGVAAAAAAVLLLVGVVAMSGSGSDSKKSDQVASGPKQTTTTTAASSTTESTATTEVSTTESTVPTTDSTVATSTVTTPSSQTTQTTGTKAPVIPPTTQASPANVQVICPGRLGSPDTGQILLQNTGGSAASFLVTWSALKTGVTVSPNTGSVPAHQNTAITVRVAPGTPGSNSKVTVKWTGGSGGSIDCNLAVQ